MASNHPNQGDNTGSATPPFAAIALLLGIASILLIAPPLSGPGPEPIASVAAVIFGHIALYRARRLGSRRMALAALVLGYVSILFWLLVLNAHPGPTDAKRLVKCVSNLKQVGLAARLWAADHDERFPSTFIEFKAELETPKLLWCPDDKSRSRATNWSMLTASNISYVIVSPGTTNHDTSTVFARCPIHGHEVMVDGSVHQKPLPSRR